MALRGAAKRSAGEVANEAYGDLKFEAMKTGIGIVAARWLEEKLMIFKSDDTSPARSKFIAETTISAARECVRDSPSICLDV